MEEVSWTLLLQITILITWTALMIDYLITSASKHHKDHIIWENMIPEELRKNRGGV